MLSNFFNSPVIIPTVKASGQAAEFADGDIVFDWVSFDIPRGPARLLGATISMRNNDVQIPHAALDLVFAKDAGTNTTPVTMGTENDIFGVSNFNRTDIIGFLPGDTSDMNGGGGTAAAVVYQTTATPAPGLILESSPNSGGTTGTDRFYVGGLAAGALDLTSGVTVNEANFGESTQTVITVTGTDATTVFAAGDVLHAADNAILGTISSVDNATQVTLTAANTDAIENTDELYNINPIRIILHFEK
jgi:hypothetical protein